MAFIDPEFYQGSPLEEETEQRVAAEEAELLQQFIDATTDDDAVDDAVDDVVDDAVDDAVAVDGEPQIQNTRYDYDNPLLRDLETRFEAQSGQMQRLLADQQQMRQANAESAYDIVYDLFVTQLGLPISLVDDVEQMLIDGASDLAVSQEIRKTQEYKDRFPVMAERAALGLPRLSEGEVLKLERAYRSTLRQAGLGEEFYDEASDFTAWLVGDVSEAELQTRVALADAAMRTANAGTKEQLADLYNITDTDLLAYYLDPKKAEDVFEARLQLEAAGLSAASIRATGAALGLETAEALRESGIQTREIEQRLSRRVGLSEELLGSEALEADVIAEGEFGTDVAAATALRRAGEERLAAFQGGGGALMNRTGITGLGRAT
tara:strand:+ start:11340 stop:12476 length:1137 start_codon:yes stop_codon:yes gene_type:complete